jgi:hypothetical protein
MAETFKMLRKVSDGRLFPYTDILAQTKGMVVVEMTSDEINPPPPEPPAEIKLKTTKDDKPGTGWVRSTRGTWRRKTETIKLTKAERDKIHEEQKAILNQLEPEDISEPTGDNQPDEI